MQHDIRKTFKLDIINMTDIQITLLPLPIIWGDKEANLRTFEVAMSNVQAGTDIVVVPEAFSTGFPAGMTYDQMRRLAEKTDGSLMNKVRQMAYKKNLAIAGSFICEDEGNLFNRAFFVQPDGKTYFADKRHLFSMGGEDKIFSRGHTRLEVIFRGWRIAMAVCYDLRFPVWLRNTQENPYDLLIIVANWPMVRTDAWQKLLYARAIENISFVAGVDCQGTDPTDHFYNGSSLIVNYMGQPIEKFEISSEHLCVSASITTKLSKEKLLKFRSRFPAHLDSDKFALL